MAYNLKFSGGMIDQILEKANQAIDSSTNSILPSHGGTGLTSLKVNSLLAGNGTGSMKPIDSKTGALYAATNGAEPQFGTLPVSCGGTGVTSMEDLASQINSSFKADVPKGGTGVSSFVPYALIAGGTTATGSVQSLGTGLANQVLMSNGADHLPTFRPQTDITAVGTIAEGTWHGSPIGPEYGGTGSTSTEDLRGNLGLGDGASLGELAVQYGGTGATSFPANAILLGNNYNAIQSLNTTEGVLFATAAGRAPQFGTLPIQYGGTGETTLSGLRSSLLELGTLEVANGGTGVTSLEALQTALGTQSIELGGTGATSAEEALTSLGALGTAGGTITGDLTINGNLSLTAANSSTAGTLAAGYAGTADYYTLLGKICLIPNISLTNNTGDSANVVTNLPLPAVETNGVLVADDGTAVQVSVTIDGILKATAALEKSKTFKGSIVYLT